LVDDFVAPSRFVRDALLDHEIKPGRICVIPNVVPGRQAADEPPSGSRDPHEVIFVGQIIPGKGAHLLIESIALLAARGVPAKATIVGQMTGWEHPTFAGYRAGLISRAEALGMGDRIAFVGYREDVPELMQRAAIHCCPSLASLREAFGVVVLEAKQARIPSVVFRSGGLPELVRHGVDGWVCETESADALAEGLAYFLQDYDRCAQAGLEAFRSLGRYERARYREKWMERLGKT
jgi:glycosyltransferase involved in cell wall biosynthesis